MVVFGIQHDGGFGDCRVTTHPHAEAAKQFVEAAKDFPSALVVIDETDLQTQLSGMGMVQLHNWLDEANPVQRFATKGDAARRTFAALTARFGQQPHETFNPVETPAVEEESTTQGVSNPSEPTEGSAIEEEGQMATKKKSKKKSTKKVAERKPRAPAALTVDLPSTLKPGADVKCGTYIRSLIMLGKTTEVILQKVKAHYPDSTAKPSDVSWNRGKLKAAGKKLPEPK